jgi:hypothetical protein
MRLPWTTHILPGCCWHFSTARNESTPSSARKACHARRMVCDSRKGLVGRRILSPPVAADAGKERLRHSAWRCLRSVRNPWIRSRRKISRSAQRLKSCKPSGDAPTGDGYSYPPPALNPPLPGSVQPRCEHVLSRQSKPGSILM